MRRGRLASRVRCAAVLALALAPCSTRAAEAVLAGHVRAPAGVLLSGYRLRFESAKGLAFETLALGRSGHFRLMRVAPGHYRVRLLTLRGDPCAVSFPEIDVGEGRTTVELTIDTPPECGPAPPPQSTTPARRGRRVWIWAGGGLGAALLGVALSNGKEPSVSKSAQ